MITTINEFKQFLNENLDDKFETFVDGILHVDLIKKYEEYSNNYRQKFEEYKSQIKGFTETLGNFQIGDIIEFNGGYNNDIRYTTEILGFDQDGDIYLLWDSYWFPIKDEEKRAIKLIKKNNQYDQDFDAMDDQTTHNDNSNYEENELRESKKINEMVSPVYLVMNQFEKASDEQKIEALKILNLYNSIENSDLTFKENYQSIVSELEKYGSTLYKLQKILKF